MRRILVTPRSLSGSEHPAIQLLRHQGWEVIFGPRGRFPAEAELLQLLPGCGGWLAGVEPISAPVLNAAKQLRVISRNGSGTDNIPLEVANRVLGGGSAARHSSWRPFSFSFPRPRAPVL